MKPAFGLALGRAFCTSSSAFFKVSCFFCSQQVLLLSTSVRSVDLGG